MRVTISGGVHGNELTGIYLIHKLRHDTPITHNIELDFLLANPKAIEACQRYVDKDLNRSFSKQALEQDSHLYEEERAKVIAKRLEGCDFLIDLHSTTANMGITLVLSNQDRKSENLAKILASEFEDVRILQWFGSEEGDFINSLVPSSVTIEVGPVCQGVLEPEIFWRTYKVLRRAIEVLDKDEWTTDSHLAYRIEGYEDFPRKDGKLWGMIHPELKGRDYGELHPGDPIFLTLDEEEIFYHSDPCVPVFINEAAYYEKKIAFCKAKPVEI